MKLKKLFEDVMGEPYFDYKLDGDKLTVKAIVNKKVVGMMELNLVSDAYHEFQDLINDDNGFTDNTFKSIFPNNRYAEIETIRVNDGERGKGYAKMLMNKAISHAKKNGEKVMYLNASPIGNSSVNVNDLVGFYKSIGFQPIIDDGHNVEMFMSI